MFSLPILAVALSTMTIRLDLLEGIVVTPHVPAETLRYGKPPSQDMGARCDVVIVNPTSKPLMLSEPRFWGESAESLRKKGTIAWHNLEQVTPMTLPAGARTVWSLNVRSVPFDPKKSIPVQLEIDSTPASISLEVEKPTCWIAALTYLGPEESAYPDRAVIHLANRTSSDLSLSKLQLFVPSDPLKPNVFDRELTLAIEGKVPPLLSNDQIVVMARSKNLPLTYGLLRVELVGTDSSTPQFLWAKTRIKKESFDISGGWVNDNTEVGRSLTYEPYLKILKRFHVNTAHIAEFPGYTDNSALYEKYPLKYFNKLEPISHYDQDEKLGRIHAVEFLGEPQYPNPEDVDSPQRVFNELAPYASSRLATTVTLSDPGTWRLYAGLSDYAHYDAYRVVAPHVDAWHKYDRWGTKRIYWGAPLETIGDMSRSLREMNRPAPTAYWSQGPASGWSGFDGRRRRSPTPDEIRLQAYHALATRITSLYWFNLSPKALVRFPDTFDELMRVGREIRMLDRYYLEGAAYDIDQPAPAEGWAQSVIATPSGALLFALDNGYQVDPKERVFAFGPPRAASFEYRLPGYIDVASLRVFRVDADGVIDVKFEKLSRGIRIEEQVSRVAIYVASTLPGERENLVNKREELLKAEQSLNLDPAREEKDLELLKRMLKK